MNSKPVIGITTRPRNDRGTFEVSAKYIDSVRRAGGVPVLLPPGEADPAAVLAGLDGLIFSGGGDIDPREYAGDDHPEIYGMDAERDAFELALARTVMGEGRTPTLGICRGMQVLTVAANGKMHPHLPDVVGEAVLHYRSDSGTSHRVSIAPDSKLAGVMKELEPLVPSWHHQAAPAAPVGWRAVAHAPDGVVEAIEHAQHPWLIGVQWHPELAPEDPAHQALFAELVANAQQFKLRKANSM